MSSNGAWHDTKTINYMERTYVFGDGGSGGSKLDVTAMLPGMMGGYRGVDPNVLALMNGNGGFGGQIRKQRRNVQLATTATAR